MDTRHCGGKPRIKAKSGIEGREDCRGTVSLVILVEQKLRYKFKTEEEIKFLA